MDKLTDQERSKAWLSDWQNPLIGKAIVEADGTFRSVNRTFCKIVGVSMAELVGKTFQDITTVDLRQLDIDNARLTMDGSQVEYVLPKTYEFADGRKVKVLLRVGRVPFQAEEDFEFFISTIVAGKGGSTLTKTMIILCSFFSDKKVLAGLGTALAAAVMYFYEGSK